MTHNPPFSYICHLIYIYIYIYIYISLFIVPISLSLEKNNVLYIIRDFILIAWMLTSMLSLCTTPNKRLTSVEEFLMLPNSEDLHFHLFIKD